jgi:Ca2+:H+ antiporter
MQAAWTKTEAGPAAHICIGAPEVYDAPEMKRRSAKDVVPTAAAIVIPTLALVVVALAWGRELAGGFLVFVALVLAVSVLAAVHHAQVVAHHLREPYASVVLAVVVTVIEVAVIVPLTVAVLRGAETLARDTVFAALMIACNGILGLSLMFAARRTFTVSFNADGAGEALATVATVSALALVLPAFIASRPGLQFSPASLAFAAVTTCVLYGLFVTLRSAGPRDYFPPTNSVSGPLDSGECPTRTTTRPVLASLILLLLALISVVGSAQLVLPTIGREAIAAGLPISIVAVAIALLVLLLPAIAAVRAAQRNRIEMSLNLAFNSAMACIGLTIPTIVIASIWLPVPPRLGLGPMHIVLLVLTFVVTMLSVMPRRATLPQAGVHLALLAAYLFLSLT